MILIADSGSTKADWILGDGSGIRATFHTKGLNPFFHDKKFIETELNSSEGISKVREEVTSVFFFGAGCSSAERNEMIAAPLRTFFINAAVVVEHDMLGTALAVCDGKPGIACILGTGSNICFFDGSRVAETRHGLGYVIGDEGSGSYYGKKLLAWYVYEIMPADLRESFRSKYGFDKENIVNKVYREPHANVFLHPSHHFCQSTGIIHSLKICFTKGTREYFETNVLSYEQSKTHPVHFVGSVAWHFRTLFTGLLTKKVFASEQSCINPLTDLQNIFSEAENACLILLIEFYRGRKEFLCVTAVADDVANNRR